MICLCFSKNNIIGNLFLFDDEINYSIYILNYILCIVLIFLFTVTLITASRVTITHICYNVFSICIFK